MRNAKQLTSDVFALLVGVSRYKDRVFPRLESAHDNINRVRYGLNKYVGQPLNQIENYLNPDCDDEREILKKLQDIIKRDNIRTILFYYSGHGVYTRDGYFLTYKDSEESNIQLTGLSISKIQNVVKNTNKNIVIIIDSCFSERAFKDLNIRNGVVIASSSRTETSKYPIGEITSVFTGALLDVLKNGIQGAGERLTLANIFDEARKKIVLKQFPKPRNKYLNGVENIEVCFNNHQAPVVEVKPFSSEYIDSLFQQLAIHSKDVNGKFYKYKQLKETGGLLDLEYTQEITKDIIKGFPFLIGEPLRRLYASKAEGFLKGYITLYKEIIRFLAFVLLVQVKKRITDTAVVEEIKNRMASSSHEDFVYFLKNLPKFLFIRSVDIEFGTIVSGSYYLERYEEYHKAIINNIDAIEPLLSKEGLTQKDILPHIESLLLNISFLAEYRLISIRTITCKKNKYSTASYTHEVGVPLPLEESSIRFNDRFDDLRERASHTESHSILLYRERETKGEKNIGFAINLWPLVVDTAAFKTNKDMIPAVYGFVGIANGEYMYKSIDNKRKDNNEVKCFSELDDDGYFKRHKSNITYFEEELGIAQ